MGESTENTLLARLLTDAPCLDWLIVTSEWLVRAAIEPTTRRVNSSSVAACHLPQIWEETLGDSGETPKWQIDCSSSSTWWSRQASDDENHEEGLVTIEGDALEEFHLQSMIIMSWRHSVWESAFVWTTMMMR